MILISFSEVNAITQKEKPRKIQRLIAIIWSGDFAVLSVFEKCHICVCLRRKNGVSNYLKLAQRERERRAADEVIQRQNGHTTRSGGRKHFEETKEERKAGRNRLAYLLHDKLHLTLTSFIHSDHFSLIYLMKLLQNYMTGEIKAASMKSQKMNHFF